MKWEKSEKMSEIKRNGSQSGEWWGNGRKNEVKNMCTITKTTGDVCKEVNQLSELVDWGESLGFTSHGQCQMSTDFEIIKDRNLAAGVRWN